MIGVIIGDIAGSRFEFNNIKTKKFNLFSNECRPTDDSIMSLAIAKALLLCNGKYDNLGEITIRTMRELGKKYEKCGFGGRFRVWLKSENPASYGSFGNGSAMRVSPVAYAANSMEEVKDLARKVTEITHNHEDGLKGGECIAVAVWMARQGQSKEEIKSEMEKYYSLDFTLDEIRPTYTFKVSCMESVPQAIVSFLESNSFEDTIRNAISIGGDCDTTAAIAGSIAEAYYGVPSDIKEKALSYLDNDLTNILNNFEEKFNSDDVLE